MANMNVFVLTISDVCDFERFSHTPQVFSKVEDAQSEMNSLVKQFEENNNLDGWVVEKDAMSYLTYEDGRMAENHYEVSIHCLEVK